MNKLATIAWMLTIAAMACGDDGGDSMAPQISAPTGLVATMVAGGAHLVWMDNSDDEGQFAVQRKSGSEDWSTVATVPANTTTYHDAAVTAGTAYVYRVVALPQGAGGESAGAASNEVMFTAPSASSMGTSGAGGASGGGSAAGAGAAGAAGGHMGGQHG